MKIIPRCAQCGYLKNPDCMCDFINQKEVQVRTVNGHLHLANMEVQEYDGFKFVVESPRKGAVRLTIYRGDDPTPLSKETYGHVSSDLDEHTEGEFSTSSL